jgi:hypothetical protein
MILYHGTTERRAQRICREGFLPRKPSRRVWFAAAHGYAMGRAKTQARRSRDRPAVLTCELNLGRLRAQFGKKRVFYKNGIVAVDGKLPVSVVRSYPGAADQPSSPNELAGWVNQVLGLPRHRGVSRKHDGILRLSTWVVHRLAERPNKSISDKQLLAKARQWLPDYFGNVVIDPERLTVARRYRAVTVDVDSQLEEADEREDKALELLDSGKSEHRIKGLRLLTELEEPDLLDWFLLCLDDPSINLRSAALQTMLRCPDNDVDLVRPLADSDSKRVRGSALLVLAHHDKEHADDWLHIGLTDPSPCVRLEAARGLEELEPATHRDIFMLALHDPNANVARRAGRLAKGKGFSTWRK